MKVSFEDEVNCKQQEPFSTADPPVLPTPPTPPPPSEDGETNVPEAADPPPPYEEPKPEDESKPKPMPTFEEDPMLHLFGMKVPKTKVGFCACNLRTTNYAVVFYITAYASMLVADAFGCTPDIIRSLYAYKFQLLLSKQDQFCLHGWMGGFLLLSAFVLWWATFTYDHTVMMGWLVVMTLFTCMSFTMWLLGLLLSLSSDGWNIPATQGIAIGSIDVGLEIYLLHIVYSYNRYMDDLPDVSHLYDPRKIAQRQYELAQLGYEEMNVMGVVLTVPRPRDAPMPPRPPAFV